MCVISLIFLVQGVLTTGVIIGCARVLIITAGIEFKKKKICAYHMYSRGEEVMGTRLRSDEQIASTVMVVKSAHHFSAPVFVQAKKVSVR